LHSPIISAKASITTVVTYSRSILRIAFQHVIADSAFLQSHTAHRTPMYVFISRASTIASSSYPHDSLIISLVSLDGLSVGDMVLFRRTVVRRSVEINGAARRSTPLRRRVFVTVVVEVVRSKPTYGALADLFVEQSSRLGRRVLFVGMVWVSSFLFSFPNRFIVWALYLLVEFQFH
jgi:hypothetical protein